MSTKDAKKTIINLTQRRPSTDQVIDGVIDYRHQDVVELLTLKELPTIEDLVTRAGELAAIAKMSGCKHAMIGGHGALMAPLEIALATIDIVPMHSFSERRVAEYVERDGTTRKESVHKHLGFIERPIREQRTFKRDKIEEGGAYQEYDKIVENT